jgi:hypothetical protein
MHIYGLYKMKNKNTNRQIYFIVIKNVFDQSLIINQRYDIKGATYNRQTINNNYSTHNQNIALKDLDLINNHPSF